MSADKAWGQGVGKITFTFHSTYSVVWIFYNKNLHKIMSYTHYFKLWKLRSWVSIPINLHFLHNKVIQRVSCLKEATDYCIVHMAVQKSGLMDSSALNWRNAIWMELHILCPHLEYDWHSAVKLHFPFDKILQQHKDPISKT